MHRGADLLSRSIFKAISIRYPAPSKTPRRRRPRDGLLGPGHGATLPVQVLAGTGQAEVLRPRCYQSPPCRAREGLRARHIVPLPPARFAAIKIVDKTIPIFEGTPLDHPHSRRRTRSSPGTQHRGFQGPRASPAKADDAASQTDGRVSVGHPLLTDYGLIRSRSPRCGQLFPTRSAIRRFRCRITSGTAGSEASFRRSRFARLGRRSATSTTLLLVIRS